jgi:ubiquitin carboxyl-terminal hydrolase 5/13
VDWEKKDKKCPHADTLVQSAGAPKLASKALSKCESCDITTDLWLCLTCGALGCSRDQ